MVLSRDKKKLHRVPAGKRSDWEGMDEKKLTFLQKVAASTYGLLTIGNVLSFIGFYLVIVGIANFSGNSILIGVIQVTIGRSLDYFDGIAADMTQTKSLLGANIDVVLDAFEFVLVVVALYYKNTIPLIVMLAIATPKALNALGYVIAQLRCKRMDTTAQSKIATAFLWTSIILYMFGEIVDDLTTMRIDLVAAAIMFVAVGLSLPSSVEYLRVSLTGKKQTN